MIPLSTRWLLFCIGAVLLGCAVDVWAAGDASVPKEFYGVPLTRATWDLAWRWINFIVLAALIFKYARAPVLLFLKGKKAETARTIQQVEEKKRLAEEKIREGQIQLKASESRLTLIQERIVAEGKKRREQMIAEAQNESRMMLVAARTRIDSHIRDAHDAIRSELIDTAYEKAMTKLPKAVTDADQREFVQAWIKEAQRL